MIVDRYPPKRLFRLAPDLPQAFAPELAQLDRLLDDDAIFCRINSMGVGGGRCGIVRGCQPTDMEATDVLLHRPPRPRCDRHPAA